MNSEQTIKNYPIALPSINMNANSIHTLAYAKFPAMALSIPVDWNMDPYGAKNWRHHLVSLRWIVELKTLDEKLRILRDFYDYHFDHLKPNDLFKTRMGDHTTSARLNVLRDLWNELHEVSSTNEQGIRLCRDLMIDDISNLLSPEIYRPGHNHGLMADTALLNSIIELDEPDLQKHVEYVILRGMQTLKRMYTDDAITSEHSVSYQEYNYPIAIEFIKLAESSLHKFDPTVRKKITETTRKFLFFFTRSNGEYFPLGDSFRIPNKQIRKNHPELNPTKHLIEETGSEGHRIFCAGGFFSYIRKIEDSRAHFVATCCWNSANHKQDDELSFCLELNGRLIFDDAGYTDFGTRDATLALRDSEHHSGVRIEGHNFSIRAAPNGQSKILDWKEHANGFYMIAMHERIAGFRIKRTFELAGNNLELTDEIETPQVGQVHTIHDFVLAPGLTGKVDGRSLHIECNGRELGVLISQSHDGEWRQHTITYVPTKRSDFIETVRYSYRSTLRKRRSFTFVSFHDNINFR